MWRYENIKNINLFYNIQIYTSKLENLNETNLLKKMKLSKKWLNQKQKILNNLITVKETKLVVKRNSRQKK